jgi:hypothetical protein
MIMKLSLSLTAGVLLVSLVLPLAPTYAATSGASCPKAGATQTTGEKKFTCVKSGKKLVWNMGVALPKPVPTRTPVAAPTPSATASPTPMPSPTPSASSEPVVFVPPESPTSFENLYQNRKGIAYAAWLKTAELMNKSEARVPPFSTFIGPNTKPWYTGVEQTFNLVSKAFPTAKLPNNVLIIFYNFNDVSWAEEKLKTLISPWNYSDLNRNEGGHLVDSNCQAAVKDCLGAKEVTTADGLDLAIMLIGVPNNPGSEGGYGDPGTYENNTTGQLLAHEYFHALQREQLVGKNLSGNDWPPRWVVEGSAYFIQNAIVNSVDFKKYSNWRQIAVGDYIKQKGISTEFVTDFMDLSHYSDAWNGFSGDWNYFLGARIIETLVALKGPESIISFYKLMGEGKGFEYSFKNVYGANYQDVVPIIAKAVAENWKSKD